jgi:hypothetical protein
VTTYFDTDEPYTFLKIIHEWHHGPGINDFVMTAPKPEHCKVCPGSGVVKNIKNCIELPTQILGSSQKGNCKVGYG